MSKYVIGLDFGTNSCRSLIIRVSDGAELASHVFNYPSGEAGVIVDPSDPNVTRQNPADYLEGIEVTVIESIKKAEQNDMQFSPQKVIGIGVDTTGSSPMPVDEQGTPLCFLDHFKNNPAAMVWLWKDHTSYEEAQLITEKASEMRPEYLANIGGIYSSEWFWSKIWHCQKEDPEVFAKAYGFIEQSDYIPAVLTGTTHPSKIKNSVCAAGHKAMYNEQWGGLPDREFLETLSPEVAQMRERLYSKAYPAEEKAGNLSSEWAEKLGLSTDVVVTVGAIDAHLGAVGAGIQTGSLVKILGTSTCDIMVWPNTEALNDIPGVCGVVDGSVMGGFYGIEAGQPAVGDIFLWFVNNCVPEIYGTNMEEKFKNLEKQASQLKPGETGLLALDWNNGNRSVLVDVRLSGLLVGQTLHTQAHEIYRALIEGTAFGALSIINRIAESGVPINDIVNCGGLASKNPLLMQIYADVTGRPMKLSRSEQTPALGAGILATVAAGKSSGGYETVEDAQKKMTGIIKVFEPIEENHVVYAKLYELYIQLHDAFGTKGWQGNLFNVMKDILAIRDQVRKK